MKKLKKNLKKRLVTDLIIISVLAGVFAITALPERVLPSYSSGRITALYNGNRNESNVSIMINVYENTEVVNEMLSLLKEKGVHATFFVGGCWADDNGETLKRIVGEGHEIGNHGYFHKDHKNLSYEKNKEEINLTNVVVSALCGVQPKLFAPPSGSYSLATLDASYDLGLKVIMWSLDTIDWRDSDTEKIFSRATKNVKNGDFILMHPKKHTLKVLPSIIDYYLKIGLTPVTVSENVKEN